MDCHVKNCYYDATINIVIKRPDGTKETKSVCRRCYRLIKIDKWEIINGDVL